MLELGLRADSGRFSGGTSCYAALNEAEKFADHLEGFPRDLTDAREYKFGGDLPGLLLGGASLRFKCIDGSGHLAVTVEIWDESKQGGRETVSVVLQAVPAQIDAFVKDLRSMEAYVGSTAFLAAAI
ncbi:hypothetical protein [Acidovorax sp. BL-A-41-H1]|uniref:hypothetical protein n=1 Tax=Acidovorax sp. BL-A-41-H1 TaxID=3421102 RepID=UPI003F7909C1